jgi:hypothetical protein
VAELTQAVTDLINSNKERDQYAIDGFKCHGDRLDRHRSYIDQDGRKLRALEVLTDQLQDKVFELEGRCESMSNRLCNCRAVSPGLLGRGTGEPIELEYETDRSYHTPPVASPVENTEPIPVPEPSPFDQAPLPSSDQENVPPCCSAPTSSRPPLAPIEEDPTDLGGEAERRQVMLDVMAKKVKVRQTCRKSRPFKNSFHPYRLPVGKGRKCPWDYFLPSHAIGRWNHRRIERGLFGYESDSESGSEGLSDQYDSDCHGVTKFNARYAGMSDPWVEGKGDRHF